MLTGFQQFLTTCIGKTEEETDAKDGDEQQLGCFCLGVSPETPPTTDGSSVDAPETTAPSTTDTEVSEPTETEEADAPPVAVDENPKTHPDSDPIPLDEDNTEANENNVPVESSVDDVSAEGKDTPQPLEPTDSVSEDDAEAPVEIVLLSEESETDPQTTETETEEVLEPISVDLGIVEEIYDFVEMFEHSTISGTEQASANGRDSSGGVTQPAIFEHPTPTEVAKIDYTVSLPDVDSNDKLLLHFSIGLRDGIVFDDTERQPGGVKFAIEISHTDKSAAPERCFESVATECRWQEEHIDLTGYAEKEIVLSLLTECNVKGNSNYAWALWGKPQLYKLKETTLRKAKRAPEPELRCGIAIVHLDSEKTEMLAFNQPISTGVSTLTDICIETLDIKERPLKMALYAAQPKLEIVSVGPTAAVVPAGEDFEIQCILRNSGSAPLGKADTARIAINGVKLRRGRPRQTIKEIEPGEETSVFWTARRLPHPTALSFSASLRCQTAAGEERQTAQGRVSVLSAQPKLTTKVTKELHTHPQDGSVVMGNKHLRIVFVCSTPSPTSDENAEGGFEYYTLFVAKGGNYQRVATSPALSEVTYLDAVEKRQTFQLVPTKYQLAGNKDESIIRLSGTNTDADGVKWDYEMRWTLTEDATRLKTEYQLQTDGDRALLAFHGPMLYAGCGRNPEKKTAALFPGLEFLENAERSSSPRDAAPPFDNRLVPHPYKITVPVMAVEIQKSVVGIIWNPLDTWDGENQMLSAIFASPNWYLHQKNHALGLFLPTAPEWVQENETEASTPYPLTPARPLSIKSQIIVNGNASILDAVTHWTDAYGTPEPLELPRSDEEELLLSRHGFMHTTWDENTRKSRHCVDWAAHNEPGFGTLLWYDYLATKDEQVKERALEIAKNTITEYGKEGLAARGSCHILRWEFPFYIGNIDAALTYMQEETQQRITTQEPDGSWQWQPTNPKTASLGKAGEAVLGTCAESALLLLKHARITGNTASREAGLKALEFMKQFSVPRGAQMWECPMYQPDVLAAAHAVGAYIEAYELTRKKEYLKRATYWAETALPFLYHWHLPDRPGMRFASIPVFGTSFHTHPWFGVPVQWNGLVLAYYLQRLNRHTKDEQWGQIAEGITVSAMYQQWEEGELKGTYPDGFYGFCTEGKGPHLNPEDIMVNIYTLRGLDPGIKTAIANDIHLSSGAKIDTLTRTNTGQLNWQLSYAENEASYALIVGYGRAPQGIRARYQFTAPSEDDATNDVEAPSNDAEASKVVEKYVETEVPAAQTLEDVESGWLYIKDKDAILVKYLHTTIDVQFELLA
ncbi:hypothetical protein C6496_15385 [Candidatus Poribacteria bacterium]|nr:MAG: hypothetical protein C6496_15385 [Candidatus Poribacteria bacterium]